MLAAGQQAIDYFEGYFPDVHPFGEEDAGNQAEWLVNITTKACLPPFLQSLPLLYVFICPVCCDSCPATAAAMYS